MTGKLLTAAAVLGVALLAEGCRTVEPVQRSEVEQIAALSNEVSRLSRRLDSIEQDWGDIKSDVQPLRDWLDEIRSLPIVQEELIGAP